MTRTGSQRTTRAGKKFDHGRAEEGIVEHRVCGIVLSDDMPCIASVGVVQGVKRNPAAALNENENLLLRSM